MLRSNQAIRTQKRILPADRATGPINPPHRNKTNVSTRPGPILDILLDGKQLQIPDAMRDLFNKTDLATAGVGYPLLQGPRLPRRCSLVTTGYGWPPGRRAVQSPYSPDTTR